MWHRIALTLWAIFKDLHTENDGKSWCPIRVATSSLLVPSVSLFAWGTVFTTHSLGHMDYTGFSVGVAALAAAITSLSAAVWAKARSDSVPHPGTGDPPCSPSSPASSTN